MQNSVMLQQMLPMQQVPTANMPQGGLVGYEQVPSGNTSPLVGSLHPNHLIGPPVPSPAGVPPAYGVLQPSDLAPFNHHLMRYCPIAAPPTQIAAMVPTAGSTRADRLEVCRDFQRGNCTRGELECRYGHPPDSSMVDSTDNTVTVCMDCIKGRCIREKCKYFHPPPHLQVKIRAAQNPGTTFLSALQPATTLSQPNMMVSNGTPLPQSPLKHHNIEPPMIPSAGNTMRNSPALTQSYPSSQNPATLPAMYGYNAVAFPGLTTVHHQAMSTAPAYYQHAMPVFHLQYGTPTCAPPTGQMSPLAAFSISTTSSSNGSSPPLSYPLQNGQSQVVLK